MHIAYILALVLLSPLAAGGQPTSTESVEGPKGYVLWNATRLERAADRLSRNLGDAAMVCETIGNYEGHSIYLVLRGQTGTSELHETESDLYIAKRGTATLVIGGKLVGV